MDKNNPYSPPSPAIPIAPRAGPRKAAYAVAVLAAIQVGVAGYQFPIYRELVLTGAIPAWIPLLALLFNLLLLLGTALLIADRGGRIILLVSGLGLLSVTLLAWRHPVMLLLILGYPIGAVAGFLGWWVAHEPKEDVSAETTGDQWTH